MGIWEGQTIADLEMQYPEEVHLFWNEPHLFQSTSGENFAAVHKRVIEGIHFLLEKHKGENILIVTHAAAAKLLVGHLQVLKLNMYGKSHLCIARALV